MKNTLSISLKSVFTRLAIEDEGRVCRDIPEQSCREEPRNYVTHIASLALTKSADGLIDPKLVLSWLMTALGAPAFLVGLLVPVREAGALLPQLFTAGYLRTLPKRKYAWSVGAIIQGLCAVAIGVTALSVQGAMAGYLIVTLLTVLALARSVCSVCYKDVLGKTVSKSRRGSATGMAGSLASIVTIIFAFTLAFEILPRFQLVTAALFIAGGAWMVSAAFFMTLNEAAGATEGGAMAFKAALKDIGLLKTDKNLQVFILTRALLTATALAPPFMVAAAGADEGAGFGGLGLLVFASAFAALLSAYIWGRLADTSSRQVLMLSSFVSASSLLVTGFLIVSGVISAPFVLPVLLFAVMIAYQGVRLGRSTHLVDMATQETRAAYTALSNTVIGVILIFGGFFSALAAWAGLAVVIFVMAGMCGLAFCVAFGLDEVQKEA